MTDDKKMKKAKDYYIKNNISQADLAAKFGIPASTIGKRCAQEGWREMRKSIDKKVAEKSIEKIAEKQSDRNARVDERIYGIAGKLMDKLEKAVDELDVVEEMISITQEDDGLVTSTKYARIRDGERGAVDRIGLRHITTALKELKGIMDIRTALDEEEQKARIEKLRRDTEQGDSGGSVTVQMEDTLDEYAG